MIEAIRLLANGLDSAAAIGGRLLTALTKDLGQPRRVATFNDAGTLWHYSHAASAGRFMAIARKSTGWRIWLASRPASGIPVMSRLGGGVAANKGFHTW